MVFILITAYGTSNSYVIRQSTSNPCLQQMSVHYFQLLVMCINYLIETFSDITLVVVCIVKPAIAFDIRNMSTLQ